jgi:hypothetical protein
MGRAPPSEGHGTGLDERLARSRWFRAPLLDARARAPHVAAAGVYRRSGGPGPPPASAKVACVSGPPRRDPAAGQPGCLGRFVSTRPGWDCSRFARFARSVVTPRAYARIAIRQTSAFSTTGTRPDPDGRSAPFVARPVSARELLAEPCDSFELLTRLRAAGPTAAPENDHCDSCQLAV